MTDYTKLVEALRRCAEPGTIIDECDTFDDCPYSLDGYCGDCMNNLVKDAAAAIEDLQAQLPKRGKWIEDATTYAGPGLSNYKRSLCGKICGTWRRGLEPSELPNWCGNCGADMRAKMEVQDG